MAHVRVKLVGMGRSVNLMWTNVVPLMTVRHTQRVRTQLDHTSVNVKSDIRQYQKQHVQVCLFLFQSYLFVM